MNVYGGWGIICGTYGKVGRGTGNRVRIKAGKRRDISTYEMARIDHLSTMVEGNFEISRYEMAVLPKSKRKKGP